MNNKKGNDIYYGKIILFGEYGIIYDSMALTIPFTHFHGELSFNNKYNRYKYTDYEFALESNAQLKLYADWLRIIIEERQLPVNFDFTQFERDLEKGLYFESTIPQGYGLGSSGALVAALYNTYAEEKIAGGRSVTKEDTLRLKRIFSVMESFFHGKSSGIDPLNSYIKFPLLINSKTDIETVGIPRNKFNGNAGIFLINTGHPGKTAPLVNHFLEKCTDPGYFRIINEEYIPLNNSIINNLINGEMEVFFKNLSALSILQMNHFDAMIPRNFREIWQLGLDTGDFILKLCGSGGGGYILGFTRDLAKTQAYFHTKDLEVVTVYKSVR